MRALLTKNEVIEAHRLFGSHKARLLRRADAVQDLARIATIYVAVHALNAEKYGTDPRKPIDALGRYAEDEVVRAVNQWNAQPANREAFIADAKRLTLKYINSRITSGATMRQLVRGEVRGKRK